MAELSKKCTLFEVLDLALGSPVLNFDLLYKLLYAIISNDIFQKCVIKLDNLKQKDEHQIKIVEEIPEISATGTENLTDNSSNEGEHAIKSNRSNISKSTNDSLDSGTTRSGELPATDSSALNFEENVVESLSIDNLGDGQPDINDLMALEDVEHLEQNKPDGSDSSTLKESLVESESSLAEDRDLKDAVEKLNEIPEGEIILLGNEDKLHPEEHSGTADENIEEVSIDPSQNSDAFDTQSLHSLGQMNLFEYSLRDQLNNLSNSLQEVNYKIEQIDEKNANYEQCLMMLTKIADENVNQIRYLKSFQQSIDERFCKIQKDHSRILWENNAIKDSMSEIDCNSRGFFSKVNRVDRDLTDVMKKVEGLSKNVFSQIMRGNKFKEDIDSLSTSKADLVDIRRALAEKADKSDIDSKATTERMELIEKDLTSALEAINAEAGRNTSALEKKIHNNSNQMQEKLVRMYDELKARIAYLRFFFNELSKHMACDSLATTTKYLQNLACLACKADNCMRMHTEVVPKLKGISTSGCRASKYTFEDDAGWLIQNNDTLKPFLDRFTGGKHTNTIPAERIFRNGNILEEHPGARSKSKPYTDGQYKHGKDGGVYRMD